MPNEKVGKYILWLAINPCGYHDAARVIVIQKITYSACQNQVFVLGTRGKDQSRKTKPFVNAIEVEGRKHCNPRKVHWAVGT